jgi:hypothetical protein
MSETNTGTGRGSGRREFLPGPWINGALVGNSPVLGSLPQYDLEGWAARCDTILISRSRTSISSISSSGHSTFYTTQVFFFVFVLGFSSCSTESVREAPCILPLHGKKNTQASLKKTRKDPL